MRALPDVTLVCIDTANHASWHCVHWRRARPDLRFARSRAVHRCGARRRCRAVLDRDRADRHAALARRLLALRAEVAARATITTSHVLLVQWDGYVANPQAWEDRFSTPTTSARAGSGTTTACRSATAGSRCARAGSWKRSPIRASTSLEAEDLTIGRTYRPLLEREYGIRFADEAMADRFAFEAAYPIGKPFGFHGLFNFCRVMTPGALAELPPRIFPMPSPARRNAPRCCAIASRVHPVAAGHRDRAAHPRRGPRARRRRAGPRAGARPRRRAAWVSAATIRVPAAAASATSSATARRTRAPSRRRTAVGKPTPLAGSRRPAPNAARGRHRHRAFPRCTGGARRRRASAQRPRRRRSRPIARHSTSTPEHPLAMHYLGVIHYQRQRLDEALALLDRSVALGAARARVP